VSIRSVLLSLGGHILVTLKNFFTNNSKELKQRIMRIKQIFQCIFNA